MDISYINVAGTFCYLCSLLEGCSRFIVHHELRESMTEAEVEIVIQRASEKHPMAKPRIISVWSKTDPHWEQVIPFFSFSPEIRRIIYTTNAIESMNMQLRKVIKI